MDVPVRRYSMTLNLGADSMEDLIRALDQLAFDFARHKELQQNYHMVSGGPDYGYSLDIAFDPEMTHERYVEAVNAYLDAKDSE